MKGGVNNTEGMHLLAAADFLLKIDGLPVGVGGVGALRGGFCMETSSTCQQLQPSSPWDAAPLAEPHPEPKARGGGVGLEAELPGCPVHNRHRNPLLQNDRGFKNTILRMI